MRKLLRQLHSKSDLGEIIEDVKDFLWYNRVSTFNKYKEMFSRMIYWGWHMRWNYDFDASTLYDIIYRKLDRVYYVMKNHSHLVWNSDENNPDMKRLREACFLAKRLSEDDYSINIDKFYSKYRSPDKTFGSVYFKDLYPEAKTLTSRKLYSYMFRKSYKRDDKLRIDETERLHSLLTKYLRVWWD